MDSSTERTQVCSMRSPLWTTNFFRKGKVHLLPTFYQLSSLVKIFFATLLTKLRVDTYTTFATDMVGEGEIKLLIIWVVIKRPTWLHHHISLLGKFVYEYMAMIREPLVLVSARPKIQSYCLRKMRTENSIITWLLLITSREFTSMT